MDAMEALLTRRSVREYADEPVPEALVEQLLRAAMQAPSAGNQQPWHFVVLRDRTLLREIARVHPYAQMCLSVPVAILVCGDESLEKYPGYWVQDCAAATQNLLLAARALGYGAVWVGIHPRAERVEAIRWLMRLPAGIHPLCLVPVGRPREHPAPQDRFNAERIRFDRWE